VLVVVSGQCSPHAPREELAFWYPMGARERATIHSYAERHDYIPKTSLEIRPALAAYSDAEMIGLRPACTICEV